MIAELSHIGKQMWQAAQALVGGAGAPAASGVVPAVGLGLEVVPLIRPPLQELLHLPEEALPRLVQLDPVIRKYRTLLGPIDWSLIPEREREGPWPGPTPHPRSAYVATFLVQLQERREYMTEVRTFLVEHPALIWLLGYRLVPAESPWGFDPQRSLPSRRHLGRVLRALPNQLLQGVFTQAVRGVQHELPPELPFGQTVSGDTKHQVAWVRENNPNEEIRGGRYNPKRFPLDGDPDCKLGVKRRANQHSAQATAGGTQADTGAAQTEAPPPATADSPPAAPAPPPTPAAPEPPTPAAPPAALPGPTRYGQAASQLTIGVTDTLYWGYASGVVATKVPGWGEFVLAERTAPFNESDVSYFQPLMAQVEARLGFRPKHGAFDAAFDAWFVHEYFADGGASPPCHLWPGGVMPSAPLMPTGSRSVRLGWPCRSKAPSCARPPVSPTNVAGTPARCCIPPPRARPAPSTTPSGPRGAVSPPWPPPRVRACAPNSTATLMSTRPSTSSAPPTNASIPRPNTWAVNIPNSAIRLPSPTATP